MHTLSWMGVYSKRYTGYPNTKAMILSMSYHAIFMNRFMENTDCLDARLKQKIGIFLEKEIYFALISVKTVLLH